LKFSFRTWRGFKGVCANRIKHSFYAWRKYKEECTLIIQKSYRDFKQVLPPDLRKNNETRLVGKKKRRHLSLTSVRRFYGDYLDVKGNSLLMAAIGPGSLEKILFSYKGKVVVHPGLLKKKKISPRTVIVTEQHIYLIMYTKVKGEIVTKLDTEMAINLITNIRFSPIADDFIILGSEEGDIVLECPFKTEVLAYLCSKNPAIQQNILFEDNIKYVVYRKKKMRKLNFSNHPNLNTLRVFTKMVSFIPHLDFLLILVLLK